MNDDDKFGAIAFITIGIVVCASIDKLASVILIVLLTLGLGILANKR